MHVVCQRAFDLLEIRYQRPWFRILHSAEEDNYSPSVSISFPYCQCIKISTNKHVSVLMYVNMYLGVNSSPNRLMPGSTPRF